MVPTPASTVALTTLPKPETLAEMKAAGSSMDFRRPP